MFKIIAVTNRKLCHIDFLEQIEALAKSEVDSIILREKDLSEDEYYVLAKNVLRICEKYNKECVLHNFVGVAKRLNYNKIHLSLPMLEKHHNEVKNFEKVGVSIHSLEEGERAVTLGATYITAGHIFQTDCKKDLEPMGLAFLENICRGVDVPVYAIGGISKDNIKLVKETGAKGACLMSSLMKAGANELKGNIY
ncbi:MAG: thiamine phosphate synthase [Clostridium paraputrificum]